MTIWTIRDSHAHEGVELYATAHSAACAAWQRIAGWGPAFLDLPEILRALHESGNLWVLCRCGREITIGTQERPD